MRYNFGRGPSLTHLAFMEDWDLCKHQEEKTLTFKLEALLTMTTVRLAQAACHIERCDKDEMKQKKVKWIETTG